MIDAAEAHKRSLEELEEIKIGAQLIIEADYTLWELFYWIEVKIYEAISKGKFSVDIQFKDLYEEFPFAETDKSWEMLIKDLGYQKIFVNELDDHRKFAKKFVTLSW